MTTPNTHPLHAALSAAERGWPVFPLRPNDKRPAFPDHPADRCAGRDPRCRTGHQGWEPRATTDPDRIRRAWSLAPFNVGIAAGPAGLVVIDLDTRKPDDTAPTPEAWRIDGVGTGEDVLAVLAERAGAPLAELYDTHTVITGRGGRHLYYTAPEGARLGNTAGTLGWLIDTRAHGGYVVAAGSVVNGHRYELAHDASPAPLPAWLFQQLVPATAPQRTAVPVALPPGRRTAYLDAVLTREAEHVTGAASGQRNHAVFMAAQNLGRLVAGGALATDVVTSVLEQAAAVHVGVDRFTLAEAQKAIASGLRAGARRPRTVAA